MTYEEWKELKRGDYVIGNNEESPQLVTYTAPVLSDGRTAKNPAYWTKWVEPKPMDWTEACLAMVGGAKVRRKGWGVAMLHCDHGVMYLSRGGARWCCSVVPPRPYSINEGDVAATDWEVCNVDSQVR